MNKINNKVIIILGPTSSGKTKLAVRLAKKFNGEIVSADSRQVYRGMDIGTGKDLKEYGKVKHHLLDIASPKGQFSLAKYQKLAYRAINNILARGRVPIICGGTGLYISALVDGYVLPQAKPNLSLRKRMAKMNSRQLLLKLKQIDPQTYKIIDQNNRRRVERALEIYYQTGKPKSAQMEKQPPPYWFLIIGPSLSREILRSRIEKRLKQRLEKEGMIKEIKKLHRQGVSWRRLEEFGLEYRWVSRFLQKKIDYQTMLNELSRAIKDFAKRQATWFRRDGRILWIKDYKTAEKLVKEFLIK
jgi:tRNA dimethylallyltransferase